MKHWLFVLLLGVTAALAEPPRGSEPKVLETFQEEIIPHLDLESPTFEQAISLIHDHWKQKHAKDLFPVALTLYSFDKDDLILEAPKFGGTEPIHLRDIPCFEALRYFTGMADVFLVNHGEILEAQWPGPTRGWGIWDYPISRHALVQLGVKLTSTREELHTAFERIGVHVKPVGNAGFELKDDGRVIAVLCDWEEKHAVEAVIHLLNAGYKISR